MAFLPAVGLFAENFELASPSGNISVRINSGKGLEYSVRLNGDEVISKSGISMVTTQGSVPRVNPKIGKAVYRTVKGGKVSSPFYRAKDIEENYNSVSLPVGDGWNVEFRAYDDGVAYRFVNLKNREVTVLSEDVVYNFPGRPSAYAAYTKPRKDDPYFNSFENEYKYETLAGLDTTRMILLPTTVTLNDSVKVTITESDLERFPGLYMNGTGGNSLSGRHAKYPKSLEQGGHNMLQMLVKERENYIAKSKGERSYPWRVAIITDDDRKLAASNLSYLLASPSRVSDLEWIKPGKVAWDWWNNWNIKGVDFKAGINNETYKRYIDFASKNGIEYVILDEGWAVNKQADLMQVVPEIDLEELIAYGKEKNVGIVLWAGYWAFDRDMENVCKHYSKMGVKGFKVDFMDRDDQQMVDFIHRASEMGNKYRLFMDFHGMYKPAGLNRTYPNVLNFEGVNGLEQMKWSGTELDQMEYDATIPYIRQVAGPMDYTPGAMRNGTKATYHKDYYEPMSQGTRGHQMALFVVFDSPFTMLCDTPDNYDAEPECRDFLASIPTVWDETRILQGKLGDYIVTARRKGDEWYVAGITDWQPRELPISLSFLGEGKYKAEIVRDGVNADSNATDFKHEIRTLSSSNRLPIRMARGGGFVIRLTPVR